jgi:molecular chaperone GrpE
MSTEPTDRPQPSTGAEAELLAGEEMVSEHNEIEQVVSVEALLDDLDRVSAERDAYLDDSRRIAAEFANFRRQVDKRNVDIVEHANLGLVEKLLPTLDACEAAATHGSVEVEPVFATLRAALEKEGLETIRPEGDEFDPTRHEAVMHEDGDGPVVVAVLRTGYAWKGRVIRPALVTVRG